MSSPQEEFKDGVKDIKYGLGSLLGFLKFATLSEPKLTGAFMSISQKIMWGSILLIPGLATESAVADFTDYAGYGLLAYGIIDAIGVSVRWIGGAK